MVIEIKRRKSVQKTHILLTYIVLVALLSGCSSESLIYSSPPIPDNLSQLDLNRAQGKLRVPIFLAPWAAGLGVSGREGKESHFCGATLIKSQWAITGAHCVIVDEVDQFVLHYGGDSLDHIKSAAISQVFIHPDYSRGSFENDVALIQIVEPLDGYLSKFPQIPSNKFNAEREADARVIGWGSIFESNLRFGNNLLQIDTRTIPIGLCNSPTWYAGQVGPNMLCAGPRLSGIDACLGFGGSGLLVEDQFTTQLIGVLSWGEGCGRLNKPGVYTDIGSYSSWIRQTISHAENSGNEF